MAPIIFISPPEFSFSASQPRRRVHFLPNARTERTFLFLSDTTLFVDAVTLRLTNKDLRQKVQNVVPLLFATLEFSEAHDDTTEMVFLLLHSAIRQTRSEFR